MCKYLVNNITNIYIIISITYILACCYQRVSLEFEVAVQSLQKYNVVCMDFFKVIFTLSHMIQHNYEHF